MSLSQVSLASSIISVTIVCATVKTKSQAQTIVTDIINAAQDTWDNDNVSGETSAEKIARLGSKPTDITLP